MREFTRPLGVLTVACVLGAASLAQAQGGPRPDSASTWYERGLQQRERKNCREAIADFGRALQLQPDHFQAWYQRGNCRQALGDYAGAVEDYSGAVAIPGRIDARFRAYFGRADAYRRLGELDRAHADYTQVIALRTNTAALRSRAWVSFYAGRWQDAYRDAEKYVHDTEAKEADAAYAVILGTLALRRSGMRERSAAFLQSWRPRLDRARWPAPVMAYLENGDQRALLAAAHAPGERTEARAYLGVDLLAAGQRARGIEILQEVLRGGEPGYFEYDLAYHELRRLNLASASDRRQPPR